MPITINSEVIDDEEIERETTRIKKEYEQYMQRHGQKVDMDQLQTWSMENLIERTLLKQAAAKNDEPISDEEVEKILEAAKKQAPDASDAELITEIKMRIKVERLVDKLTEGVPAPNDDEAVAYYELHRQHFVQPEKVRASHILKQVQGQVDFQAAYQMMVDVQASLNDGAKFEDLAVQHSDCPSKEGDLGLFERGAMVPEFDAVVFGMEVGEVSEIFQTSFGYHMAKVLEKVEESTVPFEDVKDRIKDEVFKQKQNQAVEAHIDMLKKEADIKR